MPTLLRNVAEIEADFTWGEIRRTHIIGDQYVIVEYKPNRPSNAEKGWRPTISFHTYVREEGARGRLKQSFADTAHAYDSLDRALVECVVWAHERRHRGLSAAMNSRVGRYIMRSIGPDSEED